MSIIIEVLEKNGRPMRVVEIYDYVKKNEKVSFITKTSYKTVTPIMKKQKKAISQGL